MQVSLLPLSIAALALSPTARADQVPVPADARAAIDKGDHSGAVKLLRTAAVSCVEADASHATCLDLLTALATAAARADDHTTQLTAARIAVEATAQHAPGTRYQFSALAEYASALIDSDDPASAEAPAREALALAEKLWTPRSDQTAVVCRTIAILMTLLGRHVEAETMARRALAIQVAIGGTDSLAALDYRRVLGVTLNEGGKVRAAIAELTEAADALTRAFPTRLIERATADGDLASVLSQAGRLDEAKAKYAVAIDLWNKVDRPTLAILTVLNNAAILQSQIGDYDGAIELYRVALRAKLSLSGPDHPSTASAYANLGSALDAMGRSDEALPMQQRALAIAVKTWGRDHVRTAQFRAYLASLLAPAEEEVERRAIAAIYLRDLGPTHPRTVQADHDLAAALTRLDRHAEAEILLRAVVARREALYGADNLNIADTLSELALSIARQPGARGIAEVRTLFNRAWAIQTASLGPAHRKTIETAAYVAAMSDGGTARTVSRTAQRGIIDHVSRRRDFDDTARKELGAFTPVFRQGVKISWQLAHARPPAK